MLQSIENHVQLLRDASQPIPHAVQILLDEARKMEQKRAAKRIANRKSACTSRARKKALVAEMTNMNAKLRRQAIILSLLPDLVIAIKEDGTITFCSAQVERVLRHKVEDMIGANIDDLLIPSSRIELASLVEKLVTAEKVAYEDLGKEGDESGRSSNSGNIFEAAIVSEQSDHFPLSVVKVKSHTREGESNGTSDSSRNGVADATLPRVGTQSSLTITNQSNSDNSSNRVGNNSSTGSGANDARTQRGNGNSDLDSSSSSEPKNLTKANEALNRNVRFHNEQLKIKDAKKISVSHKDDVTGDSVTANNADARLSSLMKVGVKENKLPVNMEALEDNSSSSSTDSLLAGVEDRQKKRKREEPNASDDSGYRESGESDPSREDSASSTSDASNGESKSQYAQFSFFIAHILLQCP
jgi:PAS fold.